LLDPEYVQNTMLDGARHSAHHEIFSSQSYLEQLTAPGHWEEVFYDEGEQEEEL
jgi:hypothetical protein